jgi:hypothetical protein
MDHLVNAYLDYRARAPSDGMPIVQGMSDEQPLPVGDTECLSLNNIELVDIFSE